MSKSTKAKERWNVRFIALAIAAAFTVYCIIKYGS
jgi:hypothetical protein